MKNLLLKMAIELLNGKKISSFASPSEEFKNGLSPVATSEPNLIRGYIVHIDSYGNAITNVHRSLFDRFGKDTPFIMCGNACFSTSGPWVDPLTNSDMNRNETSINIKNNLEGRVIYCFLNFRTI